MRNELVRTGLTLLAVALGVGVVIAIDLAGQAAAGSFHSSMESLTGGSDLALRAAGGIDEKWLGIVTQLPYPLEFTPRIEDFASINGRGEAISFIGLDLVAAGRAFSGSSGDRTSSPNLEDSIWVGKDLHLATGQHVRLLLNDRLHAFRVAGVLPEAAGKAILADIGVAQTVTGKVGRLDTIDVTLPKNDVAVPKGQSNPDRWAQIIRSALPATISVDPQGTRTEENRKMLGAFRWNLHVLSYIALVVGGFLIYNTISISVVRRRADIGIVRALGASRGFVLAGFLAEAGFFAIAGSLFGVAFGRVMAIGAVNLIGTTVRSLYVSSQPGSIHLTPQTLIIGVALGIGVALLAALAPAFEASFVSPIEAMARGREQFRAAVRSRWTVWWAAALLILAVGLAFLPPVDGRSIFAYISVLLGVAGTALIMPNCVLAMSAIGSRFGVRRVLNVEGLLALRSLSASIARTSVLTSALATAVAMTASVGIMVGSFRETVWLWMENQLKADFYLRPAGSPAADRYPTMQADIAERIERLPGVASVDRFRAYPITYEGMPATLAGGENSRVQDKGNIRFLPGENRREILSRLPTGDYAVVSEPFSNKHHVRAGDILSLPIGNATRHLKVLGIYYDYSAERGYVVLDRGLLLRFLPDPALSNLAVYLTPGADANTVEALISQAIGGRAVLLSSHTKLRSAAIEVFDRTFRITYALEAVAVFVAVIGIAGALLAIVIDRRREFALVRSLGAYRWQVRKIILCEAGLLGLLANAIGLALGTALSLVLVYVINKQSFGWTIQFHWPIAMLLAALSGIYLATVLAGLYPARNATHLEPMEVLREG